MLIAIRSNSQSHHGQRCWCDVQENTAVACMNGCSCPGTGTGEKPTAVMMVAIAPLMDTGGLMTIFIMTMIHVVMVFLILTE